MTVRFYKPFGVLCQFTDASGRTTLSDFVQIPNVYAAGRLDQDSEGLLILTSDGQINAAITQPRHELQKTYLVQVEGIPSEESLQLLRVGVKLKDGLTLTAHVERMEAEPDLAPRDPPIRIRKAIPTCWVQISIHEGRNRQVRRMTAAVGHPTLRLVRTHIGPISLEGLQPGEFQEILATDVEEILKYRNPTAGKKSDGASSKNNRVHVGGSRRKGNRSAARRMDGGSRRI